MFQVAAMAAQKARVGRLVSIAVAALWLMPAVALGARYDISLRGLGRSDVDPGAQQRYRNLASELASVLAPRPAQAADTLGVSGFEFSVVGTVAEINESAEHWQGQPGSPILRGAPEFEVPSRLFVPSLRVRKGLPFSTEIGLSISYLAYSEMMMFGGEFKIALHENYVRWLPAVALRAAIGRMLGSDQLDMTTAEAGVLVSHAFGVGGVMQLTPYAGAGLLLAQINPLVLDETPEVVGEANDPSSDQAGGLTGSLYNFEPIDWRDNQFPRAYAGLRVSVAMFVLLYEWSITSIPTSNVKLVGHTIKIGFDV